MMLPGVTFASHVFKGEMWGHGSMASDTPPG